jgi:hypothetical protein
MPNALLPERMSTDGYLDEVTKPFPSRLPMATLREYSDRRLGGYLRNVDSSSSSWRRLPGMLNGTVASLSKADNALFQEVSRCR